MPSPGEFLPPRARNTSGVNASWSQPKEYPRDTWLREQKEKEEKKMASLKEFLSSRGISTSKFDKSRSHSGEHPHEIWLRQQEKETTRPSYDSIPPQGHSTPGVDTSGRQFEQHPYDRWREEQDGKHVKFTEPVLKRAAGGEWNAMKVPESADQKGEAPRDAWGGVWGEGETPAEVNGEWQSSGGATEWREEW